MKTTEDLAATPLPEPGRHRRRRRRRPAVVVVAATAVVIALVALLVAVAGDDGEQVTSGSTTTQAPTTSTEPEPTSVPTTTAPSGPVTTAPGVDRSTAIWPVEGSGTSFADPVEAARDFATVFLGFTRPHVGRFEQGDTRSGEVEVRAGPDGPVTTVFVRQLSGEQTWSVLGAATDAIEVTSPSAGDEVSAPVTVTGRAWTFEGHVTVQVRQDGRVDPAGRGFVTGGGDEMRPFAGEISFAPGAGGFGALVFLTESAEDGSVLEAAAVRVRLRPGALDPAQCGPYRSPRHGLAASDMEVKVYFNCDRDGDGGVSLHPVYRVAPRSPALLRSALELLLWGPNPTERQATLGSWFSESTGDMLRSVTITGGHAVVDFGDLRAVIPGASSSAGSARLLSQLDATVFQFASVRSVEYRLLGSCEAFTEWLQFGGCERRTRSTLSAD